MQNTTATIYILKNNIENIPDDELLEKFYTTQNGEWLGILLQRYTLMLLGTCMKYLKNEHEAKDAVQQVFLKVINELPKYRVTYFKSWVYMIAKNLCLMKLRNQHNIVEIIDEQEQSDDDFDIAMLKSKEQDLQFLEASITQLNKEQQLCVTLFYLHKKSYQEIVAATGFTLMQVKSHIQNGKRNLKILIEKKRSTINE